MSIKVSIEARTLGDGSEVSDVTIGDGSAHCYIVLAAVSERDAIAFADAFIKLVDDHTLEEAVLR
jgi:hypothetical protein